MRSLMEFPIFAGMATPLFGQIAISMPVDREAIILTIANIHSNTKGNIVVNSTLEAAVRNDTPFVVELYLISGFLDHSPPDLGQFPRVLGVCAAEGPPKSCDKFA